MATIAAIFKNGRYIYKGEEYSGTIYNMLATT